MHEDSCELCGITREGKLREAGRNVDMLTHIRREGYHKVGVFSDSEEDPEFAYTVGLFHVYKHPELVVFGLDFDTAFPILDTAVELVAGGAVLTQGAKSSEILEDSSIALLDFSSEEYDDYLGQALNFYRSEHFPALMLVWPDGDGVFPWEPGAPSWLTQRQPALWSSPPPVE